MTESYKVEYHRVWIKTIEAENREEARRIAEEEMSEEPDAEDYSYSVVSPDGTCLEPVCGDEFHGTHPCGCQCQFSESKSEMVQCSCGQSVPRAIVEAVLAKRNKEVQS